MLALSDFKLRPLRSGDLSVILDWRNTERIRANMYTDHIIDPEEHRSWFNRVRKDATCRYLIVEHEGRPIGLSYLTKISRDHGTCEWGFYIGAADAPRGSGTAMGFQSMEWIFHEEQLRKASGEVLAFNLPSRKLFERLGFTRDGCLRQHVVKNGTVTDVVLYSLLKAEWHGREKARIADIYVQSQCHSVPVMTEIKT